MRRFGYQEGPHACMRVHYLQCWCPPRRCTWGTTRALPPSCAGRPSGGLLCTAPTGSWCYHWDPSETHMHAEHTQPWLFNYRNVRQGCCSLTRQLLSWFTAQLGNLLDGWTGLSVDIWMRLQRASSALFSILNRESLFSPTDWDALLDQCFIIRHKYIKTGTIWYTVLFYVHFEGCRMHRELDRKMLNDKKVWKENTCWRAVI